MTDTNLDLTTDELRTLIWMCSNEYAERVRLELSAGREPRHCETLDRILGISKKAWNALAARKKQLPAQTIDASAITTGRIEPDALAHALELVTGERAGCYVVTIDENGRLAIRAEETQEEHI